MTTPFSISRIILLACLCFASGNTYAQLKPYVAVYDIVSNGFHIGEATQILIKKGDSWLLTLSSKATGFASFFQSQPATKEQLFKMQPLPLLISAKSDSGDGEDDALKSAYFDVKNHQLYIRTGSKNKLIAHKEPLSSYLLLPIRAATMHSEQTVNVMLYDEGEVLHKQMSHQKTDSDLSVVNVHSKGSSKILRYHFKRSNLDVPFRIERIKNNEVTAYLQLKAFNLTQ